MAEPLDDVVEEEIPTEPIVLSVLDKVKIRMGIVYSDSLIKDVEIQGRIDSCVLDLLHAGVPLENLENELAIDTIERYLKGGQNDSIYIANAIKLRRIVEVV